MTDATHRISCQLGLSHEWPVILEGKMSEPHADHFDGVVMTVVRTHGGTSSQYGYQVPAEGSTVLIPRERIYFIEKLDQEGSKDA